MGIKKPIVSEIALNTFAINEFGMTTAYMLLGSDRGLLIDAGCGMYNLKEIADELCPMPYDVALTHSHGDHIGSMDMWESVYLHPDDVSALSPDKYEQNKNMLTNDYPKMMAGFGSFDAYDISFGQARYPQKNPSFLPLKDGQIFKLGNRDVLTLHTPGHTLGECVFIDENSRILFSGDAANVNLGLMGASVETAYKALLRVKERQYMFDRNFNGHIGYGSSTFNLSMPACVLDECLYIMKGILDGTANVEKKTTMFGNVCSVKYGMTLISFLPDKITD